MKIMNRNRSSQRSQLRIILTLTLSLNLIILVNLHRFLSMNSIFLYQPSGSDKLRNLNVFDNILWPHYLLVTLFYWTNFLIIYHFTKNGIFSLASAFIISQNPASLIVLFSAPLWDFLPKLITLTSLYLILKFLNGINTQNYQLNNFKRNTLNLYLVLGLFFSLMIYRIHDRHANYGLFTIIVLGVLLAKHYSISVRLFILMFIAIVILKYADPGKLMFTTLIGLTDGQLLSEGISPPSIYGNPIIFDDYNADEFIKVNAIGLREILQIMLLYSEQLYLRFANLLNFFMNPIAPFSKFEMFGFIFNLQFLINLERYILPIWLCLSAYCIFKNRNLKSVDKTTILVLLIYMLIFSTFTRFQYSQIFHFQFLGYISLFLVTQYFLSIYRQRKQFGIKKLTGSVTIIILVIILPTILKTSSSVITNSQIVELNRITKTEIEVNMLKIDPANILLYSSRIKPTSKLIIDFKSNCPTRNIRFSNYFTNQNPADYVTQANGKNSSTQIYTKDFVYSANLSSTEHKVYLPGYTNSDYKFRAIKIAVDGFECLSKVSVIFDPKKEITFPFAINLDDITMSKSRNKNFLDSADFKHFKSSIVKGSSSYLENYCTRNYNNHNYTILTDLSYVQKYNLSQAINFGCAFQGIVYATPEEIVLGEYAHPSVIEISFQSKNMNGALLYLVKKDNESLNEKNFSNSSQFPKSYLCIKEPGNYSLYIIPVKNSQNFNKSDSFIDISVSTKNNNCPQSSSRFIPDL
jgi:hypothetical protein